MMLSRVEKGLQLMEKNKKLKKGLEGAEQMMRLAGMFLKRAQGIEL